MADTPENEAASEEAVPPSSSRKWLMIAVGVVLVVAIGGGAYYWGVSRGNVAEAAEIEPAPEEEAAVMPGGIVTLNPFTVNLADRESSRFLRITIELEVETADAATALTTDTVRQTRARAAVLEVLTMQMSENLTTLEGKAALKTELVDAINAAVAPSVVMDVLFTDFVIQF